MNKENNLNAKKLRTLIILLALTAIAIIIIMLVLMTDPVNNRLKYIYNENKEGELVMPLNVSPLFTKYSGRINQRTIYKAMYVFVEDIIEDYYIKFKKQNFDEQYIAEYYEKNSNDIKKELGIEDKDEFTKFIKTLSVLQGDDLKLDSYMIIPDSITQVTRGISFELAIDYEENDRILYKLELANSSSDTKTPIKYRATDDKYKDYEYQKNDGPIVEIENPPGKVIK